MHRLGSIAAILTLMPLVVGACGFGPGQTSSSPGASQTAASLGPETDPPVVIESIDPNLPPQSDTEWGPIWNSLPASYPVFAGAEVADAEQGPVSGAFTVASNVAAPLVIAEFYRDALEEQGFGGTGLDGPLEDGSFTVWSSNSYGCDSLVTILPRGTESYITVLYSAGCDFS
ncbi:MAG: hypothetical protein ABIZ52_03700 [Candidatus Limnocylindrales bacterium]